MGCHVKIGTKILHIDKFSVPNIQQINIVFMKKCVFFYKLCFKSYLELQEIM